MLLLLLAACGLSAYDSELTPLEQGDDSGWPDSEDSGGGDTGPLDTGSGAGPGETPGTARRPAAGEVIIHELMINPTAVSDSLGEYTELRNVTGDWLDLSGFALADDDVDDSDLVPTGGALLLGPEGLLVVCAAASGNGGVSCQATIDPRSTGGGFVLANSEDEVLLLDQSGGLVDAVRYSGAFAPTGAATGLRPGKQSATANDQLVNWCTQSGKLAGGDAGTPGADNSGC